MSASAEAPMEPIETAANEIVAIVERLAATTGDDVDVAICTAVQAALEIFEEQNPGCALRRLLARGLLEEEA
jgi:hypothetical protein